MRDKIREWFVGRVILDGPWCFAWRFVQIFVVVSILAGLWHQFS